MCYYFACISFDDIFIYSIYLAGLIHSSDLLTRIKCFNPRLTITDKRKSLQFCFDFTFNAQSNSLQMTMSLQTRKWVLIGGTHTRIVLQCNISLTNQRALTFRSSSFRIISLYLPIPKITILSVWHHRHCGTRPPLFRFWDKFSRHSAWIRGRQENMNTNRTKILPQVGFKTSVPMLEQIWTTYG
jgi:hypothetical protein